MWEGVWEAGGVLTPQILHSYTLDTVSRPVQRLQQSACMDYNDERVRPCATSCCKRSSRGIISTLISTIWTE